MARVFDNLRSGDWLTRERVRLIAIAVLAASAAALVYLVITSNGLTDIHGRPLGTDFSNVYAAGAYVLEGRAAAPFDPAQQYAREQAIFGADTPFYGWHYPPFFLFIAAMLALMPYALALLVWQAVTLGLYLWAIKLIIGEANSVASAAGAATPPLAGKVTSLWLLLALAYPAVFINLGHGHNGFLTAALLGSALALLDRRPLVAGVLIGLLAYKPQFGLMIPLALMASNRWRAFAGAAATVTALVVFTTLAFGPEVWRAFLDSAGFTREVVLEAGETGWHKVQSVFSAVRMWGGPVWFAYTAQGVVILALAAALVRLWRSDAAYALKAAALCLAAILATPYSLDYDLMVLAPAIAFLTAHGLVHGFASYEKTALAVLWFAPLITRALAEKTLIPLGVVAMVTVMALVLRRANGGAVTSGWRSAADPVH